jgi:hypothetical protein
MKVGCQRWRDGLCVGGDCHRCKHSDDAPVIQNEVQWFGLGLIVLGLSIAVIMGLVLA